MKLDRTITGHEFKALAFRTAGTVISSIGSFLAIKAFLRLDRGNASVLVGLLGYMVFIPLAQLGFGRPAYGEVRQRFVSGSLGRPLVASFLKLFQTQAFGAILGFAALSIAFALSQNYTGDYVPLFVFALGQSAVASCAFQRDLAYALSCDPMFENWEFFRRLLTFLIYGGILVGLPLWAAGIALIAVSFASQKLIGKRIANLPLQDPPETRSWKDLQPGLGANARRYFVFSLNEILFYNLPLVFFTLSTRQDGIIYFGVWTKLFMLIVLPMRLVADARVNRQTNLYFSGRPAEAWHSLRQSLELAVGIVLSGILAILAFKGILLEWVGAREMVHDPWLIASLVAWGAGNSLQHVYGSFTVSYKDGFGFAFKASIFSLAVLGGTFAVFLLAGASAGQALTGAGIAYSACAWIYYLHVRRLLHAAEGTP